MLFRSTREARARLDLLHLTAQALDFAGIAVAELANIAERRIEQLLNPALSSGLPPFLVRDSGLNSGYMMAQVTAAALVTSVAAQQSSSPVAPTNDAPNPYTTVEGWAKMPAGRTWGSTSAVDIDKDGVSVWVGERCGANTCWDAAAGKMSPFDPVLKFDAKDETGTVRNWTIELGNPTDITPRGFSRRTFKTGDEVTAVLQPVKNGAPADN